MIHRANIVWDDQKHPAVHLGMTNHEGETDAAYLRKCVEFYEANKGGAGNQQLILERLSSIENMLRRGVAVGAEPHPPPDDETDNIFDDLLEQME